MLTYMTGNYTNTKNMFKKIAMRRFVVYKESLLVKFLLANALYSFSTWLISCLSPYILERTIYEEFIFSFQTILYVTSISTLGFVPTLLRYYKYNKDKYMSYFLHCITMVFIILVVCGFFPSNPFSRFLHIDNYSFINHLVFYLSAISILLYVFNRAILTASEDYNTLVKTILLISTLRIVGLILVSMLNVKANYCVLLLVCVIPMVWEYFFYCNQISKFKRAFKLEDFKDFIVFAFMTSIIGVIYVTTDRLYLLELKSLNSPNVPILSYVYGMLGIIAIFNTTFTSYFIGKLDGRNPTQISNYIKKIKSLTIPYLLFSLLSGLGLFFFVYLLYPYNCKLAGIYVFITAISSSIIAYVGLISLMTKTFNLLKMQLCVNSTNLVITLLLLKFVPNVDNVCFYVLISVVHILCELYVAGYVLWKNPIKQQ